MRLLTIPTVGILLLCVISPVSACDICGCSGAGSSPGLLPLVQRHFVGVRWQYQSYSIAAHHTGGSPTEETYHTADVWGRWQPHRRIQIISIIPYSVAGRTSQNEVALRVRGVGDITALFQYSLLDPVRQSARTWQHALQTGAGVKLPVGSSVLTDSEGVLIPPNLQPGTGSTDYLTSLLYAVRKGKAGVTLDATARFSTKNTAGYQFGHRLNAGIQGFYVLRSGKSTIIPSLGIMSDIRQEDRDKDKIKGETGGYAISSVVSIQFFRNNWAFNLNGGVPVQTNMGNGLIRPRLQCGAGVTYLISSRRNKAPQGIFKDVSMGLN